MGKSETVTLKKTKGGTEVTIKAGKGGYIDHATLAMLGINIPEPKSQAQVVTREAKEQEVK
jgi:hypothetical protein